MMNVTRLLNRAIPVIFALAVFSLIWRQGNVILAGLPKPFEMLIIVVATLILIDLFVSKESRVFVRSLWSVWRLYGLLFGVLFLFVLVGHASSTISSPEWMMFKLEVYFEYARIAMSFLVFFVAAYTVVRYRKTLRWSLLAISVSPLVLFAAFLPQLRGFFSVSGRLIGARNDPNYLATFLALGLIIASAYFLYTRSSSRWLGIFYIIVLSPLFLWAYSRAAFLSIALALISLSVVYIISERTLKDFVFVSVLGLVFIFATTASFFILPSDSQFLIYHRSVAPVFPSEVLREFMADFISNGDVELHAIVLRNTPSDTFDISRGALWKEALGRSAVSPLGFGPAYHNWNPVGTIGRPHSLWFEVVLTAGWLGFILWLTLIFSVAKRAWQLVRLRNFTGIALATSYAYLLLNSFFLDMFTLRWLWLIMGIIVGYSFLNNNEITKSIRASADL